MKKCTVTVLAEAIATATGNDLTNITGRMRIAQTEGHIRMSGRGRSAATMRPRDAANALIATVGSVMSKDVAGIVSQFRSLLSPRGVPFGARLEELIVEPPVGETEIIFDQSGCYASIAYGGGIPQEFGNLLGREDGDQRRLVSITQRTLQAVHRALDQGAPLLAANSEAAVNVVH